MKEGHDNFYDFTAFISNRFTMNLHKKADVTPLFFANFSLRAN